MVGNEAGSRILASPVHDFTLLCHLVRCCDVTLLHTDVVSKTLRSTDVNISKAASLLEKTSNYLMSVRSDFKLMDIYLAPGNSH